MVVVGLYLSDVVGFNGEGVAAVPDHQVRLFGFRFVYDFLDELLFHFSTPGSESALAKRPSYSTLEHGRVGQVITIFGKKRRTWAGPWSTIAAEARVVGGT